MGNELGFSMRSLINDTKHIFWDDPEWGFPKGKGAMEKRRLLWFKRIRRRNWLCKRKFILIKNLQAFEETFTGSNYKSYKHKYYVGQLPYDVEPVMECEASEVSKRRWMTYEDYVNHIRPYNSEKLTVLRNIDMTLKSFCLYS